MKPSGRQVEQRGKREPLRFVESVRVRRETRIGWKPAVLGGFWFLILLKCVLAHWAVVHWEMPFNSVWVWAPTLFAAAICTVTFLAGGEDPE